MKPFLGIDITEDKYNEEPSGNELACATLSNSAARRLEESYGAVSEIAKSAGLPLPLRMLEYVCGILALMLAGALILALTEVSFAEAYRNATVFFYLFIVCASGWAALFVLSVKRRAILSSEAAVLAAKALGDAAEASYAKLGVPKDAPYVDLISLPYVVKGGEVRIPGATTTAFVSTEARLHKSDTSLFITTLDTSYEIPLESLRDILTVEKKISILSWNKGEDIHHEKYEKYGLSKNQFGHISCKSYYILEFTHGDEEWGIYFPAWELVAFEAVTGLIAKS